MNKKTEIEEMAKTLELIKLQALNTVGSLNKGYGMFYAEHLVSAGYGNVRQAVKEFAEKLKELCNKRRKLFQALCDNCTSRETKLAIEYMKLRNEWIKMEQEIDNLITELYGDDKNEN